MNAPLYNRAMATRCKWDLHTNKTSTANCHSPQHTLGHGKNVGIFFRLCISSTPMLYKFFCHMFCILRFSFMYCCPVFPNGRHSRKAVITNITIKWFSTLMNLWNVLVQGPLLRVLVVTNFTFEWLLPIMNWNNVHFHVILGKKIPVTDFTLECFLSFMNWFDMSGPVMLIGGTVVTSIAFEILLSFMNW